MPSLVVRRAQHQLLRLLRDEVVRHTFFEHQRAQMFPGAHSIEQVRVEFPSAFSKDSVLTKIVVSVRNRHNRLVSHTLRGNRVAPSVVQLLQAIQSLAIPVPQLKWYSPSAHYLFYEAVPGVPLRTLAFTSPAFAKAVRGAGTALATLHRQSARGVLLLPWADELRRLKQVWSGTRRYPGPLRQLLRDAEASARPRLRQQWQKGLRVIAHNDYQGSNIIVDGSRVGIIDFSRSGRGPLAIDAGQFLAHLMVMTTSKLRPAKQQHLRKSFLAGYTAGLSAQQRRSLQATLPLFEVRAALDIALITAAYVKSSRRATQLIQPLIPTLKAIL